MRERTAARRDKNIILEGTPVPQLLKLDVATDDGSFGNRKSAMLV